MLLLDGIEQLQPIELAALQPNVEKHQIRPPRYDGIKRLVTIASRERAVPLVFEYPGHQIADVCLVVDNENFCAHAITRSRLCVKRVRSDLRFRRSPAFRWRRTAGAAKPPAGREFSRQRHV